MTLDELSKIYIEKVQRFLYLDNQYMQDDAALGPDEYEQWSEYLNWTMGVQEALETVGYQWNPEQETWEKRGGSSLYGKNP